MESLEAVCTGYNVFLISEKKMYVKKHIKSDLAIIKDSKNRGKIFQVLLHRSNNINKAMLTRAKYREYYYVMGNFSDRTFGCDLFNTLATI